MIYPQTTFAGQKVTVCNRYIELFRQEANAHQSGVDARSLRAELDALIPKAYHEHRLVWLHSHMDLRPLPRYSDHDARLYLSLVSIFVF